MKKKHFFIHKQGNNHHPILKRDLSPGQRAADKLTLFVGSWGFIFLVLFLMFFWMVINTLILFFQWDPYPFILLNFVLSCIAALTAPIILMSQNRQTERDRIIAKYDYQVNRKAEREVAILLRNQQEIKFMLRNSKITPPYKDYKDYYVFKIYQQELEKIKPTEKIPFYKKRHFDAISAAYKKAKKMSRTTHHTKEP